MMIEPFRHNSWATLRLIEFLRDLDPSLLDAAAPGGRWPVRETLAHIVGWEELLAGVAEGVPVGGPPPQFTSLDDLRERARWLGERWERYLEGAVHPERLVEQDRSSGRMVRLGTVLAQVVYHGNRHRADICGALSNLDVEPPALDGWAYGEWFSGRLGDPGRRREAV